MKILVTGANGYIGHRLLALLCSKGHRVVALVRSKERLCLDHICKDHLEILQADLLKPQTIVLPNDIDVAYYLVHSMHQSAQFEELEDQCAQNFINALEITCAGRIIFLSGLLGFGGESKHLQSRHRVEKILRAGKINATVIRSGPIIGSGSAVFEIMRDLVERLPLIFLPKAAQNLCQPIAISDVLHYLLHVLQIPESCNETFDIAGPEILSYRQMVKDFAQCRGLFRLILTLPFIPQWLAHRLLYGLTTVPYSLGKALLTSLDVSTTANLQSAERFVPNYRCLSYRQSVQRAFTCVSQNAVFSSWRDSLSWSELSPQLGCYIERPVRGCVHKKVVLSFSLPRDEIVARIWSVGGKNGWYAANWAWRFRGLLDRMVGGVGLRRGRTHPHHLHVGDCLDFWRVLVADHSAGRLLLFAEMKVPGQAWLEFKVSEPTSAPQLELVATFRPKGIFGRLYWYLLLPIHIYIFYEMARAFVAEDGKNSA